MGEPHNIVIDPDLEIYDLRTDLDALYEAVDALKAKIENAGQKGEKLTSNLKEYNTTYQQGLRAGRRWGLKITRHDPKVMGITNKQFIDRIQNAPFEDLELLETLSDLIERRIRRFKSHPKN